MLCYRSAAQQYHSGRASRAARVIQSYLQRVQRVQQQQQRRGSSGSSQASDGSGDAPYTEEQLELIRRAQRAFRTHVRQHNEDAQALRQTLISASAIDEEGERALCSIVRRAGAGEALSAPEQAQLARLQQAFRDVLERKRR
jgi:ribosomal protein S15P/S13E